MDTLTFDKKPSPSLLGSYFGARRHDWTFLRAYSSLTPRSTEECVRLAMQGVWCVTVSTIDYRLLAAHHIHDFDYERGIALVSGFVWPWARGTDKWKQRWRMEEWEVTRHFWQHNGYPHLSCYALESNTASRRWIQEECGFYSAGLFERATPEGHTVELFSQEQADIELCRQEAVRIFSGT